MTSLKKQVALCSIGTLFEWYEFTVFASLTPIISTLFFPSSSHFAAMMSTFAIFASGYIMRPIGALFFGHIGDILGRKYTLLITIFLMTGATVSIGLIPVNTSFSTIALIICRLTQGFATSGEYPSGLTLLAEQGNQKHAGFVTSFGIFATGAGCFTGAVAYAIALKCLGYNNLLDWGWRILFLIGFPLGILGFFLRKTIFESHEFKKIKQQGFVSPAPLIQLFTQHSKNLIRMVCISILANILVYVNFLYFGNYGLSIHKLKSTDVANLYLLTTFIYSITILIFGFLSDYVNKNFMLITGCILIMCFAYPLFEIITSESIRMQFFAQGLLSLLLGMILGPYSFILSKSFPVAVRCSGLSIILNISASLFGGTAPIICGGLANFFGTPLAPAFYIILTAALALGAAISMVSWQKKTSLILPAET